MKSSNRGKKGALVAVLAGVGSLVAAGLAFGNPVGFISAAVGVSEPFVMLFAGFSLVGVAALARRQLARDTQD